MRFLRDIASFLCARVSPLGIVFLAAAAFTPCVVLPAYAEEHASTVSTVVDLNLDGEVNPILATYIDEGLADAAKRHATLVVITMDTPGGLSDSMKDIIQHILSAPMPVVVFVSPTGSRGASAGFFILLSADIAAMAPGTHTGAASPLALSGQQIEPVMRKKIENDASAWIRTLAERRGRGIEPAQLTVTEAKSYTETEAVNLK